MKLHAQASILIAAKRNASVATVTGRIREGLNFADAEAGKALVPAINKIFHFDTTPLLPRSQHCLFL